MKRKKEKESSLNKEEKIANLNRQILACTSCELRETATCPVPGFGEVDAKYILIGEAPGKEEDAKGMPFVGLAGKRLDQLVKLAKIDMNECYYTNVCRCRPPANRTPRKREVEACKDYLMEEIRIIKPEYIVTLGATPLGLFSKLGVSQVHGAMLEIEIDDGNI